MGPSIVKPKFLLDSVILIDHLRGIEPATGWLDRLEEGEAVISVVTRAEVLSGGSEEEADSARKICDKFECVSLTKDDATVAAGLRRENGWKLPDALQAALARRMDIKLVTRDARGFGDKKHSLAFCPYKRK
jgi:predicted nucleic acid-binding protein